MIPTEGMLGMLGMYPSLGPNLPPAGVTCEIPQRWWSWADLGGVWGKPSPPTFPNTSVRKWLGAERNVTSDYGRFQKLLA